MHDAATVPVTPEAGPAHAPGLAGDPLLLTAACRIAVAGPPGATRAQVSGALRDVGGTVSKAELDAAVSRVAVELETRDLATAVRRRLYATERLVPAVAEALGIAPARLPSRWPVLLKGFLLARALDLPPPSEQELARFTGASGCRAAIVRAREKLDLRPYPTQQEVLDALAWRALGRLVQRDLDAWRARRFGNGDGLACLLGLPLGLDRPLKPAALFAQLAAAAAGARDVRVPALRQAVLRAWCRRAPEETLAEFAASVVAVAGSTAGVGRFGPGLVFVADAFDAWARTHPGADLADFKQRLLRAARERRVELVRANLVQAMDHERVATSEIHDGIATFHFLRLAR